MQTIFWEMYDNQSTYPTLRPWEIGLITVMGKRREVDGHSTSSISTTNSTYTTTLQEKLTYPTTREVRKIIIIFKSAKRHLGNISNRSLQKYYGGKTKNLEYVCQGLKLPTLVGIYHPIGNPYCGYIMVFPRCYGGWWLSPPPRRARRAPKTLPAMASAPRVSTLP